MRSFLGNLCCEIKKKKEKDTSFYWLTEFGSFWILWWAFDVCERSFIWLFRKLLISSADSDALNGLDIEVINTFIENWTTQRETRTMYRMRTYLSFNCLSVFYSCITRTCVYRIYQCFHQHRNIIYIIRSFVNIISCFFYWSDVHWIWTHIFFEIRLIQPLRTNLVVYFSCH